MKFMNPLGNDQCMSLIEQKSWLDRYIYVIYHNDCGLQISQYI